MQYTCSGYLTACFHCTCTPELIKPFTVHTNYSYIDYAISSLAFEHLKVYYY